MPVLQANQTSVPGATPKEKGVSSMSTLWTSRFVKDIFSNSESTTVIFFPYHTDFKMIEMSKNLLNKMEEKSKKSQLRGSALGFH